MMKEALYMFDFIENHLVLSIIIGVVLLILAFLLIKNYFKWIDTTTGYNPISGINVVISALTILTPYIATRFDNVEGISFYAVISFLIPACVLIIRNLKIKKAIHIVLVSLIQILLGIVIVIAVGFIIMISIMGFGPKRNSNNSRYQSKINETLSPAAQSWMGREYDIAQANKYGFSTVEDAIKANCSYDGRMI
jgi:positive regulator of sigma E activity